MRDYYKNEKEFIGAPFEIGSDKRDYYNPIVKKQKKENKIDNAKEQMETAKDFERRFEIYGEKAFREFTFYDLPKRKSIILGLHNSEILKRLYELEDDEKLKKIIDNKLNK